MKDWEPAEVFDMGMLVGILSLIVGVGITFLLCCLKDWVVDKIQKMFKREISIEVSHQIRLMKEREDEDGNDEPNLCVD